MTRYVVLRTAADVVELKRRLDHPEKLLTRFGALMVEDAKASFDRQALGEIKWPARYPDQKPPFLNVAGAVSDFARGRASPLPRRFDNRPAGVDTRETRNSISARVVGKDAVEVGTTAPNAQRVQSGGESTQPVTDDTKTNISKWLFKSTGKHDVFMLDFHAKKDEAAARGEGFRKALKQPKAKKGGPNVVTVEEFANQAYQSKLGWLLKPDVTSLTTLSHARPFLGVTSEMHAGLVSTAEEFFATGQV